MVAVTDKCALQHGVYEAAQLQTSNKSSYDVLLMNHIVFYSMWTAECTQ